MPNSFNTDRRTSTGRADAQTFETSVSTGIPFWDMMLSFGKASQQALGRYNPTTETAGRIGNVAARQATDAEVIPLGAETLHVDKRMIAGETTRLRRVVVETPVEQAVTLREERVVVERRRPIAAAAASTQGLLTGTVVEMTESFEVVDVWKSVGVVEEVVLRRVVTEHVETVRDTVRRDDVVIEQARLPSAGTMPATSRTETASYDAPKVVAKADRAPAGEPKKAGRPDAVTAPRAPETFHSGAAIPASDEPLDVATSTAPATLLVGEPKEPTPPLILPVTLADRPEKPAPIRKN